MHTIEAEDYRREILGYCYRYFGCFAEAEDATQETMLRAWKARDGAGFQGRSSLRTWLYSIATHVCLDMTRAPQRRALPADLTGPGRVPDDPTTLTTLPETTWIGPASDAHLGIDPSATAIERESVRLAFIAALQYLPPRQRVVLLLRDVLDHSAAECAELLGMTLPSVNSALARARKTLSQHETALPDPTENTSSSSSSSRSSSPPRSDPHVDARLLEQYVAAFEAYDVDRLVALLTDDAEFTMPPFELWLRGAEEIERWWRGPGEVCRNAHTIVTSANGRPAVAVYHQAGDQRWEPFAIHVLDSDAGRISAITHFIGAHHFAEFGLPAQLP